MDNKIMTPQDWYKEKYDSDDSPSWMGGYKYTIEKYAEYVAKEKAVAYGRWLINIALNGGASNFPINTSDSDLYEIFINEINKKP